MRHIAAGVAALVLTVAGCGGGDDPTSAESSTTTEAPSTQLAQDYAAREITHKEWLTARGAVQARIDAAKRRLSRISSTHRIEDYVGQSDLLRDAWTDLPLNRQAAIVRTVLDHVVVNPAVKGRNTFDPSRFAPVWRL
jgi:hypothetical protein